VLSMCLLNAEVNTNLDFHNLGNTKLLLVIATFPHYSLRIHSKCTMISLSSYLLNTCQNWMCLTSIFRLGYWLANQRKEYKKYLEEKSFSTMTPDRIKKLNDIGIEWNPRENVYELRLSQLREYKVATGHCNVPLRYTENPQ